MFCKFYGKNFDMKFIFLYFSAFIPMYALLILQILVEIINSNLTFDVLNIIIIITFSLLIILGIVGLLWNLKWDKSKSTEIKIIQSTNITDQHFFNYISIFILFTLSFDISHMSMFITTVIILAIIGVVYIHNKIFYINPLLNILGFSFYEIVYITKDDNTQKTAKVFYYGHHNLKDKWVKVKLTNTNFSFVDVKIINNKNKKDYKQI